MQVLLCKGALTCLSPHRQVLILLNVQHDFQAVPCAAFQCRQQRVAVQSRVEGVTFPITSIDLHKETKTNTH